MVRPLLGDWYVLHLAHAGGTAAVGDAADPDVRPLTRAGHGAGRRLRAPCEAVVSGCPRVVHGRQSPADTALKAASVGSGVGVGVGVGEGTSGVSSGVSFGVLCGVLP